ERLEVALARRPGREEKQEGCRFSRLVAKTMDPARGYMYEIARSGVDPLFAVEHTHGAGEDEERFRDRSVEVGSRAGRLRSHFPAVQAEVSVSRCSGRE